MISLLDNQMNSFLLGLLSFFIVIQCSNSVFVAIFFQQRTKGSLKDQFFQSHSNSSAFYGNTKNIYCDHSTIAFNPRSDLIIRYEQWYGQVQKLNVLAYAEDEHAQTVLVYNPDHKKNVSSMNEYPHVTISVSNVGLYTPVYSNDLWKRFVDERIVQIHQDEFGKPQSITINNQENQWHGILNQNQKYANTRAYVRIINETIALDGVICVDQFWKNDRCFSKNFG